MKTVRILNIALAAISIVGVAVAQQSPAKVGHVKGTHAAKIAKKGNHKLDRKQREKVTKEVLSKLDLTQDQKVKFRAHRDVMVAKLQDLKGSLKGATREQKRAKLMALRRENREFLRSTLTPDQRKKFATLMRQRIQNARTQSAQP